MICKIKGLSSFICTKMSNYAVIFGEDPLPVFHCFLFSQYLFATYVLIKRVIDKKLWKYLSTV